MEWFATSTNCCRTTRQTDESEGETAKSCARGHFKCNWSLLRKRTTTQVTHASWYPPAKGLQKIMRW